MDCKSCKHYDNDWDGFCKLHPEFRGKVVKDILLTYKAYDDEHDYLIITFTDNTYLSFGIYHDREKLTIKQ